MIGDLWQVTSKHDDGSTAECRWLSDQDVLAMLEGSLANISSMLTFSIVKEGTQPNIRRVFKRDLIGLDSDGSKCEACKGRMNTHEWADMDENGFVLNCSRKVSNG